MIVYVKYCMFISTLCIGFYSIKKLMKKKQKENKIKDYIDKYLNDDNLKKYRKFFMICTTESEIGNIDFYFKKEIIKDIEKDVWLKVNGMYLIYDKKVIIYYCAMKMACSFNKNINIINYLFQKSKRKELEIIDYDATLFAGACNHNENLYIIKYLSSLFKVHNLTLKKESIIFNICYKCEHINNLKYLIEEIKMNIIILFENKTSCFEIAYEFNVNILNFFCNTNYLIYMELSNFKLNKNKKKFYECLKLLNI